jgi:hypothetical protein
MTSELLVLHSGRKGTEGLDEDAFLDSAGEMKAQIADGVDAEFQRFDLPADQNGG